MRSMQRKTPWKLLKTLIAGTIFLFFFASSLITLCDSRISAVSPFPGLRRFPDGRDFKQWTGDDSKALMKVRKHVERPIE